MLSFGSGFRVQGSGFSWHLRRLCEAILSPSTVIPSEAEGSLLHCRYMHTCALSQTTPWCFLYRLSLTHGLPVCKKDPSTSALMTRKKDGCLASSFIPLHRVVPLRGTLSCAFGAGRLASQEGALMGRLGASNAPLFLSYFPLSFIPPVPYPPLRGTFPMRAMLLS